MSDDPLAIHWSRQTLGRAGWVDVELVDLTPFCCQGCQADWLAAHRNALGPAQDRPAVGWRMLGQPDRRLGETDYDVWCAACGVLIQVGLEEPLCPTGACASSLTGFPAPAGSVARPVAAGNSSPRPSSPWR
jgi:hypothetical protein